MTTNLVLLVIGMLMTCSQAIYSEADYFYNETRPLVLAHRGASGMFPEHTKGAYQTAFFDGADFVELDLQLTKDGHLVTSHDPCLKECTNVEDYMDLYGDRMGSWDGSDWGAPYTNTYIDDFLIHDFTLEELKGLRRRMRFADRNQGLNEFYTIMTLEETIDLMFELNTDFPRTDAEFPVGLYIETKMYNYYKEHGTDTAELLFKVLQSYDIETVEKASHVLPIIIECFEEDALKKFATLSDLPLIFLYTWHSNVSLQTMSGMLFELGEYVHGIGPHQKWIVDWMNEDYQEKSIFVQLCEVARLDNHPWTMRDDQLHFTANPVEENLLYFAKGVSGLFTEFPHLSKEVFVNHMGDRKIMNQRNNNFDLAKLGLQ